MHVKYMRDWTLIKVTIVSTATLRVVKKNSSELPHCKKRNAWKNRKGTGHFLSGLYPLSTAIYFNPKMQCIIQRKGKTPKTKYGNSLRINTLHCSLFLRSAKSLYRTWNIYWYIIFFDKTCIDILIFNVFIQMYYFRSKSGFWKYLNELHWLY